MNKALWYIHGANASPTSFTRIDEKLREDRRLADVSAVRVSYNCQESLPDIVDQLASKLPTNEEVFLIGHSLGGVLATAVAQKVVGQDLPAHVRGVVTLASPIGGSDSANVLQWLFPHYNLFRSISTRNSLIQSIQAAGAVVPTLSFITTSGNNPLLHEANDGVVTVASQRALHGAQKIEMPYNHFEVLLNDEVVDHIRAFIFNREGEADGLQLREAS